MTALRLPNVPGQLTIAPDGDKAGRGAALTLADRAARDGWAVSSLNPSPPRGFRIRPIGIFREVRGSDRKSD
jgi:hypothetical protein